MKKKSNDSGGKSERGKVSINKGNCFEAVETKKGMEEKTKGVKLDATIILSAAAAAAARLLKQEVQTNNEHDKAHIY